MYGKYDDPDDPDFHERQRYDDAELEMLGLMALAELMAAAGLVRRIGTNLNQAVARLNATGQRSEDLLPATEFCVQVIRRLDAAAEQVRRSIP